MRRCVWHILRDGADAPPQDEAVCASAAPSDLMVRRREAPS
jgi:hypothetical protein